MTSPSVAADSRLACSCAQLLLTSSKRLFYIDALTHKSKEVDLKAEAVKGSADTAMNVWQNGKPQRVQCITPTVAQWLEAIAKVQKGPAGMFDISAVGSVRGESTFGRTESLRAAGAQPRRLDSVTFSNNL